MTTGQRIQQARKKAGLSQKQLGEKLGLSASMIGQWENNLRKPKYGTLKKLADALNVWTYDLSSPEDTDERINRLISALEIDEVDYVPLQSEKKERYKRLASFMDKLNDDGQQEAVKRVEELTEIPRYRAETVPQPPSAPQESTDTTPPPNAPETPPEGE